MIWAKIQIIFQKTNQFPFFIHFATPLATFPSMHPSIITIRRSDNEAQLQTIAEEALGASPQQPPIYFIQ